MSRMMMNERIKIPREKKKGKENLGNNFVQFQAVRHVTVRHPDIFIEPSVSNAHMRLIIHRFSLLLQYGTCICDRRLMKYGNTF
ncbi:unnamed protein product [Rotaria socialis]